MSHDLFERANQAALANLKNILAQLLPDGRQIGKEFVARNPRRNDQRQGSFKVNLMTGRWADFALGIAGGDPVSLLAYVAGLSQLEAARELARALGVPQ